MLCLRFEAKDAFISVWAERNFFCYISPEILGNKGSSSDVSMVVGKYFEMTRHAINMMYDDPNACMHE